MKSNRYQKQKKRIMTSTIISGTLFLLSVLFIIGCVLNIIIPPKDSYILYIIVASSFLFGLLTFPASLIALHEIRMIEKVFRECLLDNFESDDDKNDTETSS